MANKKITSHYWRVRVIDTNEERDFKSYAELKLWIHKVVKTFDDLSMRFEVIEIIEKSRIEEAY